MGAHFECFVSGNKVAGAMTRVHVVQVVEATIAGVKNHVLSLVRELDRAQFDVTVACPRVRHQSYGDTSFVDELRALDVPVATINMRREIYPPTDVAAIWQLYRLFLWTGAHLVHAHSTKAGLLARPAARLAGFPAVVYSPHAFAFAGATNSLVRGLMIGVERALARWTDVLVCVSEGEREQTLRAGVAPATKLIVIHNGIEPAVFQKASRAEARMRLRIEPSIPVVGFVGRLEPQKGLPYLIKAVAELIRDRPTLLCLIVGDGSLRLPLQRQAQRLGIEDQARFLGYRSDVPALLPAMDVFVLPSLYEGLPYTVLEAMSAYVPVVATDVVGIRDVVRDGETGLLVPPRDVAALKAAVDRILDNQKLKTKLAQAGCEMVTRDFHLEDCVRRTERLYLDVLSTRQAVTPPHLQGGSRSP